MKEYRIVCSRKTVHTDGTEYNYDNVAPWISDSSLHHHITYSTKAGALKAWGKAVRAGKGVKVL